MLRIVAITLALALAAAPITATSAAEMVSIETTAGRSLRGLIDARSNADQLWLRQTEGNVVLSVPVAWDEVSSATIADESVAIGDLRSQVDDLATTGPAHLYDGPLQASRPAAAPQNSFATAPPSFHNQVRTVDILAAHLTNLDRDPAPDGVTLSIAAIGADGAPVAVNGNLRAELHGERRSTADASPHFMELERWTKAVRTVDFVDGVATYCLPFRRSQPEWQVDIAPDAEITLWLGAAGHGNYAAAAPVIVRRFDPFRDDLQQHRGTRFLQNEIYKRPTAPFGNRAGLWQWWAQ